MCPLPSVPYGLGRDCLRKDPFVFGVRRAYIRGTTNGGGRIHPESRSSDQALRLALTRISFPKALYRLAPIPNRDRHSEHDQPRSEHRLPCSERAPSVVYRNQPQYPYRTAQNTTADDKTREDRSPLRATQKHGRRERHHRALHVGSRVCPEQSSQREPFAENNQRSADLNCRDLSTAIQSEKQNRESAGRSNPNRLPSHETPLSRKLEAITSQENEQTSRLGHIGQLQSKLTASLGRRR